MLGKRRTMVVVVSLTRQIVGVLDSLLTRQRLKAYPIILLVAFAPTLVLSWLGVLPGSGLFPDFGARYTAGRLVNEGRLSGLYDLGAQLAVQRDAIPGAHGFSWFVSPPFSALIYAPLAVLPFSVSAFLWAAINVALLGASMILLKPLVPPALQERWSAAMLLVAASAPVVELVASGQDSGLVLLCVVIGARLISAERDLLAGGVMALAAIKPQLIFFVPLQLLLHRRWRVLSSFSGTGGVLLALSIWLVGLDGFKRFLETPFNPVYRTEVQEGQAWKGVSLQAWLTSLSPSQFSDNWHLVAVAAGVLLGATFLVWGRQACGSGPGLIVLPIAVAVMSSPHAMLYDLVLAVSVFVFLEGRHWTPGTRVLWAALYISTWLTTTLHMVGRILPWPAAVVAAPWSGVVWAAICAALARADRTHPHSPEELGAVARRPEREGRPA